MYTYVYIWYTGAAIFGHTEVVASLIANGHDINALSAGNRTALMGSSMNGHVKTTQLLLDNNANISITNDFGETAIDCALMKGHTEIASLLQSSSSSSSSLSSKIETLNHIVENEVDTFCRRSLSIIPRLFE